MRPEHMEDYRVHHYIFTSTSQMVYSSFLQCCPIFPSNFGQADHSNDSCAKVSERHSKGESQVTPNLWVH